MTEITEEQGQAIAYVLESFNMHNVVRCFRAVKKKWHCDEVGYYAPSRRDLYTVARDLLVEATEAGKAEAGGFRATYTVNSVGVGVYTLELVMEHWSEEVR